MQFAPILVALMMVALAHGASVGTLQDVAFELNGQEVHIPAALFKRQAGEGIVEGSISAINMPPTGGPMIPHVGGSNCGIVAIPARVSIQFCGCSQPLCPSCPCAKK